jgi:hypothetical protein
MSPEVRTMSRKRADRTRDEPLPSSAGVAAMAVTSGIHLPASLPRRASSGSGGFAVGRPPIDRHFDSNGRAEPSRFRLRRFSGLYR